MASKSFMAPPDAAAAKLVEPEPAAKTAAATPPPAPAEPGPRQDLRPLHRRKRRRCIGSGGVHSGHRQARRRGTRPVGTPPLAVKRTEFGVDVGGANSVGGLRALWRGLLKSRSNAPLAALQPIIVVKEAR